MRSTIAGCIFLLLLQATTPLIVNKVTATQQQTTAEGLAEADRLMDEVLRLYSEDKIDQAIPLAKRALEIRQTSLDPQDLRIASAARNLAQLYMLKGKRREAESLLLRAIQIDDIKLKPTDPLLISDVERYNCVLIQQEKRKQLQEFDERRAIELRKSSEHDRYWGNVKVATKTIKMPKPEYPQQPRLSSEGGIIQIRVNLDEQGRVTKAKSVCGGHPDLVAVSEAAARQARFEPVVVEDKPIRIIGYLVYHFVHR
jgi:TonB family protein